MLTDGAAVLTAVEVVGFATAVGAAAGGAGAVVGAAFAAGAEVGGADGWVPGPHAVSSSNDANVAPLSRLCVKSFIPPHRTGSSVSGTLTNVNGCGTAGK